MAPMTFRFMVMNAKKLIYKAEVSSVIFTGDKTEYEVMPYHSPLMGILKPGHILVDHTLLIPVRKGLVKFLNNECTVLAEEIRDANEPVVEGAAPVRRE
ncbi:MAG: hypothetical protein PHS37_02125 [Candidatus Omnitrophica bacterium]|nr:hypothetical protein [Candidatus Omnitrophota bacterium]